MNRFGSITDCCYSFAMALLFLTACGDTDETTESNHENTTFIGSLEITNSADLETLENISTINGDLIITSQGLEEISINGLRKINGNLTIRQNTTLRDINISNLQDVGGITVESNTSVKNIHLPLLEQSGSLLEFENNQELTNIDLPSLRKIGSILLINANTRIIQINAPLLSDVNSHFFINRNPSLTTLELSSLSLVGGVLEITDNINLDSCNVSDIVNNLEPENNQEFSTERNGVCR